MSETAVREVLERAQAWRALGRAFSPPRDAAKLGDDLAALRERAQGPLAEALTAALAALADEASEQLVDVYDRLFGGRGGVPARESAYADPRVVAPAELADVRGFLHAFGLAETGELADHVAAECELASVLALKQAWALGQGWDERAEIARHAYERLLADHLLRWAPRFAACVRASQAPAFYVASAAALAALLESEAKRLGLASVSGDGLAPMPSSPDEIACGGGCPAVCDSPGA